MTATPEIPSYTFVEEDNLLRLLVAQWREMDAIGIDTEFVRTNTFFPKPGLIQVASEDGCFIVDPLAITDTTPLRELFTDLSVTKVLHSCSEDLELFDCYLGVLPEPLFDTQIASAFLNKGLSLSYKNTVQEVFGVELPKGEQRSDWLQRPLSSRQLDYAALDVEFLLEIYQQFRQHLLDSGKLAWFEEECSLMLDKQRQVIAPEDAYQRVKAAWRLNPEELARLQRIAEWRETEARSADTPRGFLLKDPVLLELVQIAPRSMGELRQIEGIHPRILRVYGDKLLELCADNQESGKRMTGEITPVPGPLPRNLSSYVKSLRKWVEQCAERNDISPELLFNRKTLNEMVFSLQQSGDAEFPASVSAWRRQCCGEEMLDFLSEMKRSM